MKNLLITALLTVIVSLGLSSCGKKAQDDNSTPAANNPEKVDANLVEETHRDLLEAITLGQIEKVKTVLDLQTQVDLNKILSNDETLLTSAVISDQPEIVQLLLKRDVSLSRTNKRKETPLMVAARLGRLGLVKFLTLNSKTDLKDLEGNTALHLAILNQHEEIALYLINNNANFEITNDLNLTPLKLAEGFEMRDVVNLLKAKVLARMDRPDRASLEKLLLLSNTESIAQIFDRYEDLPKLYSDFDMVTFIVRNREHDDIITLLKVLLEHGSLLNRLEDQQTTALMTAIDRSFLDIVTILLDNEANPNTVIKGETALLHALKKNSPQTVKILLRNGSLPKYTYLKNGKKITVAACDFARKERSKLKAEDQRQRMEESMQYLSCGLRGFL